MAYGPGKKREALVLLDEGLSLGEVARTIGVSKGSVARWKNEGPDDESRVAEDADESVLGEQLLSKAAAMLVAIELLDPKSASDKANAVGKLTETYLKLQGRGNESTVTVEQFDGKPLPDLLAELVKLPTPPSQAAS